MGAFKSVGALPSQETLIRLSLFFLVLLEAANGTGLESVRERLDRVRIRAAATTKEVGEIPRHGQRASLLWMGQDRSLEGSMQHSSNVNDNFHSEEGSESYVIDKVYDLDDDVHGSTAGPDYVRDPDCASRIYCSVERPASQDTSVFLTGIVLLRVYGDDKSGLTSYDLINWLQYMQYAGVERYYVFDAWERLGESQQSILQPYIDSGYVTYFDWHHKTPYNIDRTQIGAYQYFHDNFGETTKWALTMDIDEYPFVVGDYQQGFLHRIIRSLSQEHPDGAQFKLSNYVYLGDPSPEQATSELLCERLLRREESNMNTLVKSIVLVEKIKQAGVHHSTMHLGAQTINISPTVCRMNHYWGGRIGGSEAVQHRTVVDHSIFEITKNLRECVCYPSTLTNAEQPSSEYTFLGGSTRDGHSKLAKESGAEVLERRRKQLLSTGTLPATHE